MMLSSADIAEELIGFAEAIYEAKEKEYGEEILKHVPRNSPEYGEAYRLRSFLSYFTPISDQAIPHTSLLREFLGGSSFHY